MSSFLRVTMIATQTMIYRIEINKLFSITPCYPLRFEVELDLCKWELGDTKSLDSVFYNTGMTRSFYRNIHVVPSLTVILENYSTCCTL